MTPEPELIGGETVLMPWGNDEVKGTVLDVIGGGPLPTYVVLELTPELSGSVVDEPTTMTWPIDEVRRVERTAPTQ